MTDKEIAEDMVSAAWLTRHSPSTVHARRFGRVNVAFSIIGNGDHNYLAMLSVSNASKRREREIVRLFFGDDGVCPDKEPYKERLAYCTKYTAYYEPKEEV